MQPIRPEEVQNKKNQAFPDEVIEAFNELIVEKWNGSSATIYQEDVIQRIYDKMENTTREIIYSNNWLDVESLFRLFGWKVKYDKPGYNENYRAHFIFSK